MTKKKLYLTQDWIDACGGIKHIEELFKIYGYEVEVILIPYSYNRESNE